MSDLSRTLDDSSPLSETGSTSGRSSWAGIGGLALLVWKFKSVLAFVVTKGKFLLAGLTKSGTFFSMFLSLGVYWAAFGWEFALGLVVSIYVHEMGHVAALQRLGILASAPMFLPDIGAVVRMEQYPVDGQEDARVGLAGPLWGLGAALAAYGVFLTTGEPIWGAIARAGAGINPFNLLPVSERFLVAALLAGLWFWTGEGLLVLLLLVAGFRAWAAEPFGKGVRTAFARFGVLLFALSALIRIEVPL